ncbi:DNA internalization-related competence protein ComEC/Rec2 [Lachnoclostridium sp. Marseille-P6806]|uniref:DNA internalization-related competence protein ComEC/Rec2 n=1 Tax=Lachnoclostridium sp. Marseille-P6806 TaxID=2364793 RepID=UPI0010312209|nr:DNA internalization-related competence protein ComEC/Rec2 [Lachnoclostridium sp. Marseille-P6806]
MRRPLCTVSLILAAVLFIILALSPPEPYPFAAWDGKTITVSGIVCAKEPKGSADGTEFLQLTLREIAAECDEPDPISAAPGEAFRAQGETPESFPCAQGAIARLSGKGAALRTADAALPIGSWVRLAGTLRCFPQATNPGEFDSRSYYQTLRISFRIDDVRILSSEGSGAPVGVALYRIKRALARILEHCAWSEEDAGILRAMLLGERGGLPEETRELYKESGIIHIIAISGLHISILGMGLFRLLLRVQKRFLPLRFLTWQALGPALISVSFMLFYGNMTGMSSSSARAVIMFCFHMGALLCRRTYDLSTAAAAAAALILTAEPRCLCSAGFLFSFGAVAAIAVLMPVFQSRGMKALSIPLATLPVYLHFYGLFPVFSPLLNLFVLPLMTALMLGGLATLFLGGLYLPLGRLPGLLCHGILFSYRSLCRFSMALPGCRLICGKPEPWETVLFFAMLLVLILMERRRWRLPELWKALWVLAAVLLLFHRDRSGLELHILDVGQGDGLVICADGVNIMIDGGSVSKRDTGKYQIEPFLHSVGAGHIDLAVLTHDDTDHCSGLIAMLEDGYDIRRVALPVLRAEKGKGQETDGNYQKITALCRERGIPICFPERGDELLFPRSPRLRMLCLHPSAAASYEGANEGSLTFLLRYGSFTAVLTGDLEKRGEEDCLAFLIERGLPEEGGITVLKVGHHGSGGASSAEWLSQLCPRTAVISCGKNNRYGHPAAETLRRLEEAGCEILETRQDGEICFSTDGRRLRTERFLR